MSDGVVGGGLIDGRFRLLTLLGQGQTGQVWQAIDEQAGVPVAVKLYRGRPGQHPEASMRHPCVVSIFFLGTHEGVDYTVMELVEGVSLATVLEEGPIPRGDAVGIAIRVCDALRAAHAAGITHGNLKPSNVLIAEGGVVKVSDFTGLGDPGEDMYALGLLMEAMSGHRDAVVERLLSRDPFTAEQLFSILTGSGPAPGLVPGLSAPDPEDEPEPDRPKLMRLAVITGVATLLVVIAACAWFLAPSSPPDVSSEGPSGGGQPSTSVEASLEPSVSPDASKPAAAPAAGTSNSAINAAKAVIAGQLKTGNIQPEAASALDAKLDEIARFASRGQTKQVNDRVAAFKSQLASFRQAGKVTADGYSAILGAVSKISA